MKSNLLTKSIPLVLICVLFSCKQQELYEGAICITNTTIIDADQQSDAMTVIIKGDRILRVGKSSEFNLSPENNIVDGTGKYLIPGLWDTHVHFAYIEDLAPAMFDLFLAYGVTSVRDTGGKIDFVNDWKQKALADPQNSPRVMIAGPLLDGMPNVYDGSTPSRPELSVGAASVEDAVRIVNDLDDVGVDLIKAYEMLTPEQMEAVAKEAQAKGLKVTGHVPLSMDAISASNAGMNSMEHLRNLEMSFASNWKELLSSRRKMLEDGSSMAGGTLRGNIHTAQRIEAINNQDEEQTRKVLEVFAKNDTWQIPTLSIMMASARRHFARDDWKETFNYLPQSVEENWRNGVATVEEMEVSESSTIYSDWLSSTTKKVNDAGIAIMAGTDCPIFFLTPGYSLHEELVLLVEAGMSPQEAIESATVKPAEYFGLENELGLIRENYIADLVLLGANPYEDISNTRTVESVIKNGKYHDRSALDAMLERAGSR